MIKVVSHGKFYGLRKVCQKCGCVFDFNLADCGIDTMLCGMGVYGERVVESNMNINCPECGYIIQIKEEDYV